MRTRKLKIILIVAAVVRLAVLAAAWDHPARLFTPDSADYDQLCENLIEEGVFARDSQPEIFRTPGYPFFMAFAALFGDWMPQATALAQIAIDVFLVYLTFLLGMLLCDQRVGLWAAALQAVATVSIAASTRILSDSLFAFMLILSILMLAEHFSSGKWWSLISAAVVAGLACYVRAVGLMFCVLAVAVLMLGPKRFRRAGAFAGIVLAAVAPWVVRNMIVADYAGFSSFATDSMYIYSAPAVLARAEGRDAEDVFREMVAEEYSYWYFLSHDERTPGRLARYRQRRALAAITDHPGLYAQIHLRGSLGVWLPGITGVLESVGLTAGQKGSLAVLHAEGLVAAARHYFYGKGWLMWLCVPAGALLAGKYFFAILCAAGRIRLPMPSAYWLVLLTVVGFAVVAGPAATPRFRVPMAPLLSLAAAGGIVWLADRLKRRKSQSQQ